MIEGCLIADAELPRKGGVNRPITEVAVGILIRPDGDFLLTSRPPGKAYEGYWEFPGGKLEAGESVLQALVRELHEELGIVVDSATLWKKKPLTILMLWFACIFARSFTGEEALKCVKANSLHGSVCLL